MTKQEFIDRLRSALNGKISPNQVMENVNFYEDYINTEMRKGRTEADILQTLGDPRLIARTIVETYGNNNEPEAGNDAYQNAGYRNAEYRYGENAQQHDDVPVVKKIRLPGWVWAIIVIVIVMALLSAVLSILSFLAPAIITFAVVIFLVKLFRDWLN